jgi:chorismate mutase
MIKPLKMVTVCTEIETMLVMTDELEKLRRQIDSLDATLLDILAKRARLVDKIGRYKKARGLEPLDNARWQQVLESNKNRAESLNLCPEFVEALYHLIHDYSLRLESKSETDA